MNDRDEADLKLERLVDHELHQLPLRRAPMHLEARVFAELARRAAMPWWQRSFVQWPTAARVLLLGVCTILSGLTIVGGAQIVVNLGAALRPARELDRALALLSASKDVVATLVGTIPPMWIYEGLALAAVLYAALFALGTAAYRTLYLEA
jgi:hypothetical protein